MRITAQIGGPSPFPIITDFLAYAINRIAEASANSIHVKEVKNVPSRS